MIAYWGNPGYAVLAGTGQAAGPLAASSSMSLASAFRPSVAAAGTNGIGRGPVPSGIVPGRTAGSMYAEPTPVSLGGVTYELPAPLAYVSPLVLDLDGDGVLSASRGLWQPHPSKLTGPYATFDLDGDGYPDVTEWLRPGDGLLSTSPLPKSGRDLVGTAGGWRDGFAYLRAVFDLDQNGRVEGAELNGLYVWQDANTNGLAEPGEVLSAQSARIDGLVASHSGDYVASFSSTSGSTGRLWDWWPNYALALRRAPTPAGTGLPMVGLDAMAAIRNILFGRPVDDNSPPRTASLPGPIHIPPEQLAALGVDIDDLGRPQGTFRIALLADGGRAIIGYDARGSSSGPADRARLIRLRGKYENGLIDLDFASLPFEEIYQVACNPSGRIALVLGNHGSKLALVDFETGTVTPPEGLDLHRIGLRGSGLAGDPMVRYSGTGNFWFSAWQLNEQGEVIDERVWAITPWGFCGGLSLTSLRNELGQLRSYFVTDATSGFFATPTPGGTNETLWWVNGTNRLAIAEADSFGGMHAVSLAGREETGAQTGVHQVTYTWRTGETYGWDYWQSGCTAGSDTCHVAIATGKAPYFYPLLTDGGGTAIAARLGAIDRTFDYQVWATTPGQTNVDVLNSSPGQGRATLGAFAHYGTNGIDILPMGDPAPAPPAATWHYTLLPGSQLTDDCPVCGRPPIIVPMRGTFGLRLIQENPLFATYALEDLAFDAGGPPGTTYKVRGNGVYHVGGEAGLLQDLSLEVRIDNGFTNTLCYFTNAVPQVTRGWPLIQITVDQTNGTDVLQYRPALTAAPVREIWFSTAHGFTPGTEPPSNRYLKAGDLLSATGRPVKRNQELTRNLGLLPSPDPPELGLDALDILPGGEVAFSLEQDVFSETLGSLQHGYLLTSRGRVLARNQELTRAFVILPPVPDVGLDAAQVLDTGEILFSIETDVFSGTGGCSGVATCSAARVEWSRPAKNCSPASIRRPSQPTSAWTPSTSGPAARSGSRSTRAFATRCWATSGPATCSAIAGNCCTGTSSCCASSSRSKIWLTSVWTRCLSCPMPRHHPRHRGVSRCRCLPRQTTSSWSLTGRGACSNSRRQPTSLAPGCPSVRSVSSWSSRTPARSRTARRPSIACCNGERSLAQASPVIPRLSVQVGRLWPHRAVGHWSHPQGGGLRTRPPYHLILGRARVSSPRRRVLASSPRRRTEDRSALPQSATALFGMH